jgi:hypothetical protein
MNALLVGLTLLLNAAPCFVASDASVGWKQVTLPFDLFALAAPEGIDQFRSNEPVTLIQSHSSVFLAGTDDGVGVTSFDFHLGDGGRSLEVTFTKPLRGAKVDVNATSNLGWMSLMEQRRQGGATLALTWGATNVSRVTVRVHQHLRNAPVLASWTTVRRLPTSRIAMSEAFRLDRSLYYWQPAGPAVVLCNAPGRELKMREEAIDLLEHRPLPVVLRNP